MFPSILIVDDEASILQSLSGLLSDEGFDVLTASNGYEALKIIDAESPDLVLLDIWMQGIDGIDTLKEIKKENPFIQVIIITGHGTIETAITATKLGAFDLIEKPLSFEKVIVSINNALSFRRLEEENRYLKKRIIEKHSLTGSSAPIMALKQQIAAAAPADSWVLISGENGTGKELVARTIHQLSPRSTEALVTVSCSAITDSQVESELFGHERGAFAEARAKKRGRLESAHKGTLFLDEISDVGVGAQATILRALERQSFQRLGGSRDLHVDVRVIASTNRDLEMEVAEERFREDLYFRLNVIPIAVPPLRERKDDIPALIDTFLEECADQNRSIKKTMTAAALDRLCGYSWPGNVRELKNMAERMSIMVSNQTIDIDDIPHLENR